MFERGCTGREAVNCALPLPRERWERLNELARADGAGVEDFLPSSMLVLCDRIMENYGGQRELTVDCPFLEGYLFLRDRLAVHEAGGASPKLCLLERPTGGWEGFKQNMAEAGIDVENLPVGQGSTGVDVMGDETDVEEP